MRKQRTPYIRTVSKNRMSIALDTIHGIQLNESRNSTQQESNELMISPLDPKEQSPRSLQLNEQVESPRRKYHSRKTIIAMDQNEHSEIVSVNLSMIDSPIDYSKLSYNEMISKPVDEIEKKLTISNESHMNKVSLFEKGSMKLNEEKNKMIEKLKGCTNDSVRKSVHSRMSYKSNEIKVIKEHGDKRFRTSVLKRNDEIELVPVIESCNEKKYILRAKDQRVFRFEILGSNEQDMDFPFAMTNEFLFEKERVQTQRRSVGVNIDWKEIERDVRTDFKRRTIQVNPNSLQSRMSRECSIPVEFIPNDMELSKSGSSTGSPTNNGSTPTNGLEHTLTCTQTQVIPNTNEMVDIFRKSSVGDIGAIEEMNKLLETMTDEEIEKLSKQISMEYEHEREMKLRNENMTEEEKRARQIEKQMKHDPNYPIVEFIKSGLCGMEYIKFHVNGMILIDPTIQDEVCITGFEFNKEIIKFNGMITSIVIDKIKGIKNCVIWFETITNTRIRDFCFID